MSHLSTYVGIFLDQNSKGLLNKLRTFVPKDWVWYGDHMTIKFFGVPTYPEDFPEPYNELATSGKEVKLVVSHIGISDNAIAVKVDGYPMESQTAHITLATPMGGSPKQSKNITNWKKIKPFTLHGTIMGNGDAGEQVVGEEDLTSDTLVPFKGERRAELDGKDYLETVWAAPTMHVSYGGNMTESIVKNLVARKLNEISFNDIKHLLRELHLIWVTPDGKVIEADAHEELLNQLYPDNDISSYDKYYKAFREGYVRVKYGQYATGSSVKIDFSVEGTNRNNIRNVVNAYLPYISTQETIVTIEDPTDNYYTFTLPKHKWQLEEFLETGKYDRRNMSEALITKLVLKELTTTFPFNVGNVENTYQSWTDTAGDANKAKLSTNNVELQEIARVDITKFPFVQALEKAGGKVYQVGGYTRDEILGKESKDLDIVVSGLKDTNVVGILSKFGTLAKKSDTEGTGFVGESFSVIKFKPFGAAEDIDIALARIDINTGDRYKDVKPFSDPTITILQDLARRDITINSIAKDTKGNIIDPYNGREDLKNGIIRMVTPQSFPEDPVRILRAIQFASRFHFKIEPVTYQAMKDNAYRVAKEDGERLVIEFDKMIHKGNPKECAQYMVDTGVYKAIFQADFKGTFDDFAKVTRMSEFVFLLTKDELKSPSTFWMQRLRGKKDIANEIKAFEYTREDIKTPADQRWLLSKIEELYRTHPEGRVQNAIGSFVVQDKIGDVSKHPAEKYPRLKNLLPVTKDDIEAAGIKGIGYGNLQTDLMNMVYNDQMPNTREAMLQYIQQNADKYKTNTPKKIKEITTRLLKEYYGQGTIDQLEKALFKYYQEAYDVRAAAYITPSGRLLSMMPRDGNSRDDHRSIGNIMQDLNIPLGQYDTPQWKHSETKWMYLAMEMGFIRTMPESNKEADLDMRTAPTGNQMTRIEELINAHNGRTVLDLRDGDREASIMYDLETPTEWVMEEIRRFYYYGENPRPWRGYDALDDEDLMEKKEIQAKDIIDVPAHPKKTDRLEYWCNDHNLPANLKNRLHVGKTPTPEQEAKLDTSKTFLGYDPYGTPVYLIDGEFVRQFVYPDFSLGGNDMAYPNFVPKNQIWVEEDIVKGNRETTIAHESMERHEMFTMHKFYDVGSEDSEHGAHIDALEREHEMRSGKIPPIQLTKEPLNENAGLAQESLSLYHGSPHSFDKFSTQHMGKGEGAQAFGWGLYFTELPDIARHYASINPDMFNADMAKIAQYVYYQPNAEDLKLIRTMPIDNRNRLINQSYEMNVAEIKKMCGGSEKMAQMIYRCSQDEAIQRETTKRDQLLKASNEQKRNLYQVTVHKDKTPDQYDWMVWDKPVPEHQIAKIRQYLSRSRESDYDNADAYYRIRHYAREMDDPNFAPQKKTGEKIYRDLENYLGSKGASMFLLHAGIDGIKYPAESIQHGKTSDNARGFDYVVFDDKAVTMDRAEMLKEKQTPNIIQKLTKQKLQEIAMKSRQNQLKRLVVFDMDHTLLTSPMPEFGREEWKEKTGEEYPHKKAWWSTPESLDADVFDIKAIAPVFNQMRDEQRRSDTMVVVMTNRLDSLEKEVRRVMKLNRINPDQLSMAEYAMQNKGDRILQILKDNPSIRYVAFYDDQEKNIMDVRNALKKKGITYDLYNCQDGKIRRT